MDWATAEFADLDLGDARLSKRLVKLVEAFARQPMASIPAACGGWAETQAAYRFLSDESIDWQDMLSPHWKCTQERMRLHAVVLCIQDTTELDFNGQQIAGLGRLSYEAQRGMYLHPTYAVSVDREPLGVIDVCLWAREKKGSEADLTAPLESHRWVEGHATGVCGGPGGRSDGADSPCSGAGDAGGLVDPVEAQPQAAAGEAGGIGTEVSEISGF